MVRYVVTLILAMGRNMKFITTLTLFLIALKKILDIIYIYGYLNQPMAQNIL